VRLVVKTEGSGRLSRWPSRRGIAMGMRLYAQRAVEDGWSAGWPDLAMMQAGGLRTAGWSACRLTGCTGREEGQ
jgi:hypothetical protein